MNTRDLSKSAALFAALSLISCAMMPASAAAQANDLAATVNERPIHWQDVQRQVDRVLRGRKVTPAARQQLRSAALEQLISRELILLFLESHQSAPSSQDVDVELSRITKRLTLEEKTLDQYLTTAKMTEPQFRTLLRWQLGWQWYLDRYMTDANLRKYFYEHRAEFDGTKLRVAQILFKTTPADPTSVSAAMAKCKELASKLNDGSLKFAAAAATHSESPSGKNGGDIGWIFRDRPMQESFSSAAFQLKVGEISSPVVTPVGVHLIQCLEKAPGQRKWSDVREPLKTAVTAYLFKWVADQERSKASIKRMNDPVGG